MLNGAESAILPSGIAVPVNEYDHQTGNQKKSEGRSSESAPVSVHSGDYHMPADSGHAMFAGRSGRSATIVVNWPEPKHDLGFVLDPNGFPISAKMPFV